MTREPTSITALIPMKGHSERLPDKNIRPLCGKLLYHWIVEALFSCRHVRRVVIETDADPIAEDVGLNFPDVHILRRPAHLVGDAVPVNDLIEFHMSELGDGVYLQTHATNPLLRPETIDQAIETYFASDDNDSLFGVTAWQTRFFFPDGRPVNHNPDELLPTQDLQQLYEENSNIYIFTPESFAKRHHRIGKTPVMFFIDKLEAVDINDIADFTFAEFLMSERLERQSKAS